MKKNIKYLIVTTIIIISTISTGIYFRLNTEKKEETKAVENKDKPTAVVRVETITAQKKPLIISINTTGTAKAIKQVNISAKTTGEIESIMVHEGSFVDKKTTILELDNEEYLLNLQQTENDLTTAKINYGVRKRQDKKDSISIKKENSASGNLNNITKKLKSLENKFNSNKIEKEIYENSKLELEVEELFLSGNKDKILKNSSGLSRAFIDYKRAKINFNNTVIKAPFSGYIADLNAVKGQNINSGQAVAKLVDISTIKMEIPILESEIGEIELNRKVRVTFNSYPDKQFTGKIKHISPIVDQQTKTCKVIVYLQNPGNKIKPGMNGDVTIDGKIYNNRLLVPKEAIIVRDNRKLLFIVDEGKAKWLYVETGLENFDFVEILTKLKEGMEVIVSNNYTLAHDANVKVIKKN